MLGELRPTHLFAHPGLPGRSPSLPPAERLLESSAQATVALHTVRWPVVAATLFSLAAWGAVVLGARAILG